MAVYGHGTYKNFGGRQNGLFISPKTRDPYNAN